MRQDYRDAQRLGERAYRRATAEGRYPYLPALDDILEQEGKLAEIPVGTIEIPVDHIVGTKTRGRQQAFACNFMPIMNEATEFAIKWGDLYDAHYSEGIRDAISCYEYRKLFYVLEGNKRVSVMKYADAPYIAANVTRILPVRTDDKATRIYYEFVEFYKVAPIYEIDFSAEGSYKRFAEAVGRDLETPWPTDYVKEVRACYAEFSKLFNEHGGDDLDITVGDAFLIYLTVYPLDSLMSESHTVLQDRIHRLWNEFLTETNIEHNQLVDSPEEIERTRSFLDIFNQLPLYTKERPLKAAFIYSKNPGNSSWTYGHELGRQSLESTFGGCVATMKFENCPDDASVRKAIDDAVAAGCEVIFTTTPVQMEETLRSAIHFGQVKFLNCSLNIAHNAVRTYYGKMYESKFLLGALAAMTATNHKIGYLADYPIYGTVANINAFALGAAMIDPRARIHLKWSTEEGVNWRQEFRQEGVYVISGPDFIKPEEASREYGVYMLDPVDNDLVQNLGAPMWDWGRYYEIIIRSILDGSWGSNNVVSKDTAMNYWYGFKSGVVDVILSSKLPYTSRRMIETLKRGIVEARIFPFEGELHSQEGIIKEAGSPNLSHNEIITMSWLADNVVGAMPEKKDLNQEAKDTVQVSGVMADSQDDVE